MLNNRKRLRPRKKNVCLRKSRWPKKCPPGRQGIHFFSNLQTIHTNLSFQRNKRNKRTVKVNKANLVYIMLQCHSALIRSYFNSCLSKHLNSNNRTSECRHSNYQCSAQNKCRGQKNDLGQRRLIISLAFPRAPLKKSPHLAIFSTFCRVCIFYDKFNQRIDHLPCLYRNYMQEKCFT